MTDLPIKVSNTSAKPATGKTSGGSDTARQDAQDFSNVLARQVDTNKPSESASRSAEDKPTQTSAQEKSEAVSTEETGNTAPADMLAILLAQQIQNAASQPGIQTPTESGGLPDSGVISDANPETVADTKTGIDLTAAQDKTTKAALALLNGKTNPANAPIIESVKLQPQPANTNQNLKGLADTFKSSVMKEISTFPGNQAAHSTGAINEQASLMQQSAVMPLVTSTATSNSPVSIDAAVNQPAWGDEFSQKITWMATQRNQSAELHLNPPQLGPLDVVLKMSGDQASATFTSPHAAVREAIEQAIPKLREMLADSGIMLGNAMVSDNTTRHGQDNPRNEAAGRTSASVSPDIGEGIVAQETRVSPASRHLGLVDTFA